MIVTGEREKWDKTAFSSRQRQNCNVTAYGTKSIVSAIMFDMLVFVVFLFVAFFCEDSVRAISRREKESKKASSA